jgi:hypothetical protein
MNFRSRVYKWQALRDCMAELTLKPIREAVITTMDGKIIKRKSFSIAKNSTIVCYEKIAGENKWFDCHVDTDGDRYDDTIISKINTIGVNPENICNKYPLRVITGMSTIPLKSGTKCTIIPAGLTYELQCGKKIS